MTDQQGQVLIGREAAQPWVEVAQSARVSDSLLRKLGQPSDGSQFQKVDAHYPTYLASRWVRGYLSAGLEHLVMWADFAAPYKFHAEQEIHHNLRPVQALSRAALESSSQAVWIMAGGSARECARRHLTLVLHDLEEQRKAALDADERADLAGRRQTIVDNLESVTSVKELLTFPSYLSLIQSATREVRAKGSRDLPPENEIIRIWRAAAGAMHGRHWPGEELQIEVATGDTYSRVPDPEAITRALKLADDVTTYGVLRFADFIGSASSIASLLMESFETLAGKITLLEGTSLDLATLKTAQFIEKMP